MGVNEKQNNKGKKNIGGYLLLGISSFGLLGISVYYVFFNEQPEPVAIEQNQNKTLKEENQTKKRKTKKVVLDPVIDNVYWSIASFAVYYSVYLGLRYSGYKDQTFWVIPALVVLGKLGLITFSSFYYQKNSFLQNLNKSINPAYFIHQDIYQIVLSLVGYLGLATLIYFDWKKPEQQPGGQQPGGQFPGGQQPIVGGEQPIEQPGGPKPGEIPGLGGIPILQPKIGNQNEENKNNNEQLNLIAIQNNLTSFQNANNLFAKVVIHINKFFEKDFILLQNNGLNEFNDVIKKGIQDRKISQAGIKNLIYGKDFLEKTKGDDDYFLGRKECRKTPLIDCLISFLAQFTSDENDKKAMINFFLSEITKDPSDNRIAQLKELINEWFYFVNCIKFFLIRMDGHYIFKNIFKNIFKTAQEVQDLHLNFLRKIAEKANLVLPDQQQNIPNDKKIEEYYKFFKTKEVAKDIFCKGLIYKIGEIDELVVFKILGDLFFEKEAQIQQQA